MKREDDVDSMIEKFKKRKIDAERGKDETFKRKGNLWQNLTTRKL
jgi:hypothetical protein